jgi:hypothetical protein
MLYFHDFNIAFTNSLLLKGVMSSSGVIEYQGIFVLAPFEGSVQIQAAPLRKRIVQHPKNRGRIVSSPIQLPKHTLPLPRRQFQNQTNPTFLMPRV